MVALPTDPRLRYLSADQIRGPLERFDHVDVRNEHGDSIGKLDGIVIDPPTRQMRYLVIDVESDRNHRRYLVPPTTSRLDADHQELRIDLDKEDVEQCVGFEAGAFHRYSADDLIAAMFPDTP